MTTGHSQACADAASENIFTKPKASQQRHCVRLTAPVSARKSKFSLAETEQDHADCLCRDTRLRSGRQLSGDGANAAAASRRCGQQSLRQRPPRHAAGRDLVRPHLLGLPRSRRDRRARDRRWPAASSSMVAATTSCSPPSAAACRARRCRPSPPCPPTMSGGWSPISRACPARPAIRASPPAMRQRRDDFLRQGRLHQLSWINGRGADWLFFGKAGCTSCHEINGRGADLAADLSAEGAKPVGAIKTGVLHQIRAPLPAHAAHFADVVTADGKTLHGLVRNEDAFFIQLEMTDGSWATLDKKNVRSVTNTGSALPTDIATKLSAKEIDDVVAFLARQKARDFAQTAKINPAPVLPYARLANPKSRRLADLLGRLSGHAFQRPGPDQRRQCEEPADGVDVAPARHLHAPRPRPSWWTASCMPPAARAMSLPSTPAPASRSGPSIASRTSRTPTRTIPTTRAWRCWTAASLSARSMTF